ncbi:hypothetical protein B566_EDAN007685 [Ephemera danica]|nr:hypothetical protein B566_EDAN007685 [Ephemera danica]
MMEGQKWKDMRAKLTPTFTSGRMKAMFPLVLECVTRLEKFVEGIADSGQDVDIKDLLARYTTDVIGSCAFGIKCDSINDPNNEFRVMGRQMFHSNLFSALKRVIMLASPQISRLLRISNTPESLNDFFRTLVRNVMAARAKTGETRKDFIQLLMEIKEKGSISDTNEKFTDDDVTAQALVFFIAGFETSSTALTFALFELARRPDLQRTAKRHIEEVLERFDGQLTYQSIQEMTYLDWILQESLRKYPPLSMLPRICTKNYVIPGTDIVLEEGTHIVIPIHAIHNDPTHFPDPETFNPDRFSEETTANQNLFLAFGEGPRQCIGLRFAKMQSKLALAMLLRKFENPFRMLEITIGLAVVAIALIYYYFTSTFNHWRDKGVAFVTPYPVVGSMTTVLTLQEHLSEFYGRVYNDHSDKLFVGFYRLSEERDPLQARNLFNMSGQKWKNMRAKLTPTFTSGRMKAMCPLVIECAEVFEKHLESLADTNVDLDIKDLLARYTTDVIGKCAFGIKVDSINNPQDIFRVQGRKLFESNVIQGLRLVLTASAPQVANILKITLLPKELDQFFRNLVRDVIETRKKNNNYKQKDFMQLLMEIKEKGRLLDEHEDEDLKNDLSSGQSHTENSSNSEIKFTDDDITAQALVFFIAGFETSSSAMTFAMFELARRPELQRTARLHIEEVLQRHGGKVTYQALQDMTYLDWILQESLRKYPPLPFLNRKCNKNFLIPGTNITIEKGQPIVIPIRSLQNDAKYFPEPERFDPERLRFARMQSKLGLIAVLRKYEVRPSPETKYPLSWDPQLFLLVSKMLEITIGLAVVALALIYYYFTSTFNHWRNKGVAFVKPYPVVGSITTVLTLQEHLSEFYGRVYNDHSDKLFVGFYRVRK